MDENLLCVELIRNMSELWDRKINFHVQSMGMMTIDTLVMYELGRCENYEMNMKIMEKRLCATQPDITRMAVRLEKKGYVVKEADDNDKRAKKIRLTEEGLKELENIKREFHLGNAALMKGMSKKEQKQFEELLQKAYQNSIDYMDIFLV